MNEGSQLLFGDASGYVTLEGARVWGLVLWIGLALLTVSLLVLSRTRWGQARPLSKCVALSIFAHILFFGYAYGTKLIFPRPLPAATDGEVMKLTFASPDLQTKTEKENGPRPPWEQFVSQEKPQPEALNMQRRDTPIEKAILDKSFTEPTLVAAGALIDQARSADPERPTVELPNTDALHATTPAAAVATTEQSTATRQADATPVGPQASRLERQTAAGVPTPSPERSVVDALPGDLFDFNSRLQRLTDVAVASSASAVRDRIDSVARASNASDRPTETAGQKTPKASDVGGSRSATADVSVQMALRRVDRGVGGASGPRPNDSAAPIPRRLGDGQQLPAVYQLRVAADRVPVAQRHGGNAQTEAAVEAALQWLAENQSTDGRWNAALFGAGLENKVFGHDRRGAGADADTGITGLALLAFLGAGHSHLEGKYRLNVQHGLEFLLRSQQANGNLAGDARQFAIMYCHGMATLALSEAYALSGDPRLRTFVDRAVEYTVNAQHRSGGGWRYQPGDEGDMSQFGWQVMALKSAELGGVEVPARTVAGMERFLTNASSGTYGGLASYRRGERPSATMTAEALTCRYFLKLATDEMAVREAASFISQEIPSDGKANLYLWYYGTLAMYHVQGDQWETWNAALQHQLLSRQRTEGQHVGSWDPDTVWGGYGGRVYSTAMAALCLEVYYRYLPDATNQQLSP